MCAFFTDDMRRWSSQVLPNFYVGRSLIREIVAWSSRNAVSFSIGSALFLRVPLGNQTYRELVYRPFQFQNAVSNSSRLFGGFAPDFPHYISGKGI